jgi:uncharacterized membrane protein
MIKLLNCVPLAIVGGTLLLTPNFTRRGVLFAVPVSDTFRGSADARRAISLFRTAVAMALFVGLLALWLLPPGAWSELAPVLLLMLVAGLAFYKGNRIVAPFRSVSHGERSVEMTAAPDRLPRFFWLAIGPFVLLLLAGLFLRYHWDAIPARFPIHWGADGTANGWATKGFKGVFGPIFFAAEMCAWIVLCALGCWFGGRRTGIRAGVLEMMIAVEYMLAIVLVVVTVAPVLAIPSWVILLLSLAPLPILVGYMVKIASQPSAPEITPEECWKGGMIYYNPNDPVLVVEKRASFGYTFNFANPWSWALMGVLAVVVASAPWMFS